MAANDVVKVDHLFKQYETDAGPQPVLTDVTLSIAAGEFAAVMGPSGSGKSTFMNILGCLDIPTRGRYLLDGNDTGTLNPDELARLRNRFIGFVFQGFNLLSRAKLIDNVALPLLYAGMKKSEREARAQELLAQVGLERYTRYMPNQISGGQQQRVAIARAIAGDPKLVLADEPTGNLDSLMARQVMDLLEKINELGTTIIMVTHDPELARRAHRNVQVVDGQISDFKPFEGHGAPHAHLKAVENTAGA